MLYAPLPHRRRYALTERGRFWLAAVAFCALWWLGVVSFLTWVF